MSNNSGPTHIYGICSLFSLELSVQRVDAFFATFTKVCKTIRPQRSSQLLFSRKYRFAKSLDSSLGGWDLGEEIMHSVPLKLITTCIKLKAKRYQACAEKQCNIGVRNIVNNVSHGLFLALWTKIVYHKHPYCFRKTHLLICHQKMHHSCRL